jgi:hypothetical protein
MDQNSSLEPRAWHLREHSGHLVHLACPDVPSCTLQILDRSLVDQCMQASGLLHSQVRSRNIYDLGAYPKMSIPYRKLAVPVGKMISRQGDGQVENTLLC